MKIVSWNVNGLRSVLYYHPWCHKGKDERLQALIESFECDIFCMQETKITRQHLSSDIAIVNNYHSFHSMCEKRGGYSGASTFVKQSCSFPAIRAQNGFSGLLPNTHSKKINKERLITTPELQSILKAGILKMENGYFDKYNFHDSEESESQETSHGNGNSNISCEQLLMELDKEGRCMITDHGLFLLFNIYFPNGNMSYKRFDFKCKYHKCIEIVLFYFKFILQRNIIIVGDFNSKYLIKDDCDPNRCIKEKSKFIKNDAQFIHNRYERLWLTRLVLPPKKHETATTTTTTQSGNTAINAENLLDLVLDLDDKLNKLVSCEQQEQQEEISQSSQKPEISGNLLLENDKTKKKKQKNIENFGDIMTSGECEGLGLIDSYRVIDPNRKKAYTCWDTYTNSRQTNYGTRIDYILVDSNLITMTRPNQQNIDNSNNNGKDKDKENDNVDNGSNSNSNNGSSSNSSIQTQTKETECDGNHSCDGEHKSSEKNRKCETAITITMTETEQQATILAKDASINIDTADNNSNNINIAYKENENEKENKENKENKEHIDGSYIDDAEVLQSIMGSDHCPVMCKLILNQTEENIETIKNSNKSRNGKNCQIPKLAARYLPEFSGKQTKLSSFFGNNKKSNNLGKDKNGQKRVIQEKSRTNARKRSFSSLDNDNSNSNHNSNSNTNDFSTSTNREKIERSNSDSDINKMKWQEEPPKKKSKLNRFNSSTTNITSKNSNTNKRSSKSRSQSKSKNKNKNKNESRNTTGKVQPNLMQFMQSCKYNGGRKSINCNTKSNENIANMGNVSNDGSFETGNSSSATNVAIVNVDNGDNGKNGIGSTFNNNNITSNGNDDGLNVDFESLLNNAKKQEKSKKEWNNIFGSKTNTRKRKNAPLCRHHEPCVLRTVTKKNENKGRKFYVCARGKGAKNDPNAQCNFFEWV